MSHINSDYRVELDAYSGPLDLLLFLVKRHEIDLHDVPIAQLTDQYLHHVEVIKTLDMENVGEFLVMAATLLEIKSQLLVPRASTDQGQATDGDPNLTPAMSSLDPRYELVKQLLAYKHLKDAANRLEKRRLDWDLRFARTPSRAARPMITLEDAPDPDLIENAEPLDLDVEDVHVMDLCDAFARILASIGQAPATHNVVYDDTPIALHAEDILDRLSRDGVLSSVSDEQSPSVGKRLTLREIFVGRTSRGEMVGLFLAVLELVRQRKVAVVQTDVASDLVLELRPKSDQEQPASSTDPATDALHRWRNAQTGEIEYEWPSEADRKRAERRAKLRATFAAKRAAGEKIDEDAELAELAQDEADRAAILAEDSVPGS
jgi:segregation and condensation protein A